MATDPILVGGVKWPNNFQNPTGVIAGAAQDKLSPQAIESRNMPAESARPAYEPTKVDMTPSTDSTKGRAIDTYA